MHNYAYLFSICPQLVQNNQQPVEVSDPPLALSHPASEEASAGEEGTVCHGSSVTATRASPARQFQVGNAAKSRMFQNSTFQSIIFTGIKRRKGVHSNKFIIKVFYTL